MCNTTKRNKQKGGGEMLGNLLCCLAGVFTGVALVFYWRFWQKYWQGDYDWSPFDPLPDRLFWINLAIFFVLMCCIPVFWLLYFWLWVGV